MSYLNKANEDAKTLAPEQVSEGPRVGWLDSWEVSWNAQTRGPSETCSGASVLASSFALFK